MPDDVFLPYIVAFGPYTLNTMTNKVVQVTPDGADRSVVLTRFEAVLLECLAKRAGEIVHRDQIYWNLYGDGPQPSSNGVEVFVRRLRRKLDPDGSTDLIKTVRGKGYQLRADWPIAAGEKAA